MKVQPYLFFEGRCEEAADFYREVLGAEIQFMMRYKDNPEPAKPGMLPAGSEDRIMHMNLRIGDTQIMASDGMCNGRPEMSGFRLSLELPNTVEAERVYAALGEGGQVRMPLAKTFFADAFAMLDDRYGTPWMLIVPAAAPQG